MKIKVNDTIYDANEMPIMLIFENDLERYKMAQNLMNMVELDGRRKYAIFPSDIPQETIKEFMKLNDEK